MSCDQRVVLFWHGELNVSRVHRCNSGYAHANLPAVDLVAISNKRYARMAAFATLLRYKAAGYQLQRNKHHLPKA